MRTRAVVPTRDREAGGKDARAAVQGSINRRSMHAEVADFLRDVIAEGELPPGRRISERDLCEHLGISRTPLREALKVLASEGLVEMTPHRGTRVVRLTLKEVDDLFQVMGALEALSGELACRFVEDADMRQIEALHRAMVEHFERGDLPNYFRLNQQIHEKIVAIADNEVLAKTYLGLAGRIRHYRYMANLSRPRWKQAVREHDDIIAALAKRDGPRLGDILRRHLKNKCAVVKLAVAAEAKLEKPSRPRPAAARRRRARA